MHVLENDKRMDEGIFSHPVEVTYCFFNKKRFLSCKNIHQTIDLIDLIDTRLVKVIGFKLPEVFIMFYLIFLSLLLSIIIRIITRSFEYAISLFCLLIVKKGLTILFIFDDD